MKYFKLTRERLFAISVTCLVSGTAAIIFNEIIPEKNLSVGQKSFTIAFFSVFCLLFFNFLEQVFNSSWFERIRNFCRGIKNNIVNFGVNASVNFSRYTSETRKTEKFKAAVKEQIRTSNRIYIRLISGYTLFYEDQERYIIETLREIEREEIKKKDIKIQLLDRNKEVFKKRAKVFVDRLEKEQAVNRISFNEYLNKCKEIETLLSEIVGGKERVNWYVRKQLWRLHIFDNIIFVSTYLKDGNSTPAYSFTRESDACLFDGFLQEFNNLYSANA